VTSLSIHALPGVPEISPGADLTSIIVAALERAGLALRAGDILVVAQKAVSKAEGRFVDLRSVVPDAESLRLASATGKDARLVHAILAESVAVLRARVNVLITRHRLGFVMAQGGVDRSNVPGAETALLLPVDPDSSAARLRESLMSRGNPAVGVIVSDSFGRPWRVGTTNVALGAAGVPSTWDRRGDRDREGRTLQVTIIAWADAIAAAAGLAMGEGPEGTPVVLVRGLACPAPASPASALIRPAEEDLFS
jgi:coenzyme F420-0:L-glutamate ligase/coenzyme F420-1:gamma-L-glutamate ligase